MTVAGILGSGFGLLTADEAIVKLKCQRNKSGEMVANSISLLKKRFADSELTVLVLFVILTSYNN